MVTGAERSYTSFISLFLYFYSESIGTLGVGRCSFRTHHMTDKTTGYKITNNSRGGMIPQAGIATRRGRVALILDLT